MTAEAVVVVAPVFLITGAAKRIGAALTQILHQCDARVVLHANRSADVAQAIAEKLNAIRPDSAFVIQKDLLAPHAAPQIIAQAVGHFGRLDGLVNNASSFFPTAMGEITEADWDDLVGTNFKAPLLLCQAAAPHLKKTHGAIVNITDIHAERPLAGYPLYSAAKGALLALTRALAIELAPSIRVNAVAPGPILWPEGGNKGSGQFSTDEQTSIIEHTLLKRAGHPDEIAKTVKFLLTEATYITGQVINVDGGRTAHL